MTDSSFNPEIFKAYDIRGKYGVDFDEQFAESLGGAVKEYLKAGTLVVARDLRASSAQLAEKLVVGASEAGAEIINLGTATTPFFYWATQYLNAQGGIMITASHNSENDNGFKIVNGAGVNIGLENGLEQIKKLLRSDLKAGVPRADLGEKVSSPILTREYTDFIIKASRLKPGEIKLAFMVEDNPLVGKELAPILQVLALTPTSHSPLVTFEFDPDGDRLYVFGQQRNGSTGLTTSKIPADFILGILAKEASGFWTGPKVVHDHRFSRAVLEDIRKYGVHLYPARVGHTFIKQMMRQRRADLGAELSGHFYFSETGGSESSVLAMLKLLKILQKYNCPIEQLIKPFQKYCRTEKAISNDKFPMTNQAQNLNFGEIKKRLKEKFADGEISELDGLTISYWDPANPAEAGRGARWWFNLRPSHTEPLWRLTVEAKDPELLNQKVAELSALLKEK